MLPVRSCFTALAPEKTYAVWPIMKSTIFEATADEGTEYPREIAA
jgi:hypothetical protein